MARGKKERVLRQSRITVIGEGLTERWYFDHLRTVMGYRYDCKPRFFTHQSYEEMRKLIEWVLQNEGIAVCVCDTDITRNNTAENQRFKEMKEYYADNNMVIICDSMPSIEFWFLLHYIDTCRHYNSSTEVAAALRHYLPSFQKHSSFLEKVQWVKDLCADGKLQSANERAKLLSNCQTRNSYSNIYKAIEFFQSNKSTN